MRYWLALGASLMACGGSPGPDPLMNTPVDMYRGASTILIHRPMSVGTRMQVQGVFRKHMRKTALLNGFVLAQDKEDLQLVYDVGKTFTKLDLDGYPKVVHYDVGFVESSDADLPPLAAVAEGRVARLRSADAISVARSGGQSFDLRRMDGSYEVTALSGKLSDVERRALSHPFGPGYEMWFESALAALVGPKSPQREGGEWDVDPERAKELLELFAELAPPMKVKGRVAFVGTEKLNGVLVQRIQASIVGEGGLKHELSTKVHANINRVELSYTGLFPVDLGLPPLAHEWRVKGKGHMVIEIRDVLGDVHFELAAEHQSTVVEVRR